MKKRIALLVGILIFNMSIFNSNAMEDEVRAVWISTVFNRDWPKTKNNESKQKIEYVELLDKMNQIGINTVVVQVRPMADAIYKSNINPWSEYISGKQGYDPGYDILPFLIEEAHKRGMKFHAWFNPYRVSTSTSNVDNLSESHPSRKNPTWVIKYKKNGSDALTYNPGLPEVRKHIVDTVSEVVHNYDIDGIHFDDYFYPDENFDDEETYKQYGKGQNKDDWRRSNVNKMLEEVRYAIKSIKPNVKFGVSPSGIWRNQSSDSTGSPTNGQESYSKLYADSRAWIKQGLIDYIAPQIYWPIGYLLADYEKLVDWWSNEVKGTNVDLYIGQGIYKQGEADYGGQNIANEIKEQIKINRQYAEIKGSIYFSSKDIIRNSKLQSDIKELNADNIKVKTLEGNERQDTAIEISKEGWKDGADAAIIVNGNAIVDGITATPLATHYDAPILLSTTNYLHISTQNELKRLNPKKIIIIGSEDVVGNKIEKDIKSILPETKIERFGGIDRYETSLLVAKEIDRLYPVSKVYISNGFKEADALSIASKAGEENVPIILTDRDYITKDVYNWLTSKKIEDAYFIGDETVVSDSIIKKVNDITVVDISKNRVGGDDRQDTNAKVIETFYNDTLYNSVIVTKRDPLVDALTAGPLAAKLKSPIVIAGNSITQTQINILDTKSTSLVYEIGGGINQNSLKTIIEILK